MPAKPGKERPLLELFLSEYEDGSWRDPHPYWADEHEDSAVEVIASRPSDGLKLAVEHTLMQPFPQDRETTKNLVDHFGPVHEDKTLGVPEQETYVNLPEVALRNGCGCNFPQLCSDVHAWIKTNRFSFPEGNSFHDCPTTAGTKAGVTTVRLHTRVVPSPGSSGRLILRRYGDEKIPDVVSKALRTKLEKLARADAQRRILLLQREQWTLSEEQIVGEIEKRRPDFPLLDRVDQVWIVETVGTRDDDAYVEFKLYKHDRNVESSSFHNRQLQSRFKDGMPIPGYRNG